MKNGGALLALDVSSSQLFFTLETKLHPNIGEKHYKKYMSHLLTVFLLFAFEHFG